MYGKLNNDETLPLLFENLGVHNGTQYNYIQNKKIIFIKKKNTFNLNHHGIDFKTQKCIKCITSLTCKCCTRLTNS